jgi:hypothetical protein
MCPQKKGPGPVQVHFPRRDVKSLERFTEKLQVTFRVPIIDHARQELFSPSSFKGVEEGVGTFPHATQLVSDILGSREGSLPELQNALDQCFF